MKRLVFLFVPLLASCAVYDALTMTGFDPNEYRIITEIRAMRIVTNYNVTRQLLRVMLVPWQIKHSCLRYTVSKYPATKMGTAPVKV